MAEAVTRCERFILDGQPHLVATANAEMLMLAQEDEELADILRQADLVVPDGAGVVWAARQQGQPLPERVAGFDLVQRLLELAAAKAYSVYMLGGAPGIAQQAAARAKTLYPGLHVAGINDGYFSPEQEDTILSAIREAKPHILLVALGVPRQEKWIVRHRQELKTPLAIGVGGTFDVMAGAVARAPLWMQNSGLEWLYRLLLQPSRAKRMLALPRFALRVMLAKSIRQK
ncbi:MAG: WecB/TagA/CpsF family glycosyltransferase [Negativicutes bacterium]|nr:WecB/TagA/CpsF family glycosyltransferase [Negativicutes bacterium]